MSERIRYLGRVDSVSPDSTTVRLEPIAMTRESDRTWLVVTNPLESFPARGRVVLFDAESTVVRRSYWLFELVETFNFDATDPTKKEQYRAEHLAPALEVLDVRHLGDAEAARRRMVTVGINLSFTPCNRVYLWIEPTLWVGPIELRRLPSGAWGLDPEQAGMEALRASPAMPDSGTALRLECPRFFLHYGATIRPGGSLDWSSDSKVLRALLKRARELDPSFAMALGISRDTIRHYSDLLGREASASSDRVLAEQRLRRAEEILSGLGIDADAAARIADQLCDLPSIRVELEQLRCTAEREARETGERAVAEESRVARENIARTLADIAILEKQLVTLRAEIAREQTRADDTIASYESALAERVKSVSAEPARFAAEISLIRAILHQDNRAPRTPTFVLDLPTSEGIEFLTDQPELPKRLIDAAAATGIQMEHLRIFHAVVASGLIPLVRGGHAALLVDTYASVVAGNHLHKVPVTLSMLTPSDCLREGVLEVLRSSQESQQLHILVLEGVDVSPIDSYLVPLLEWYVASTPTAKLVARYTDNRDTDSVSHPTSWPRNVLLAGTLSRDTVVFRAPTSLWRYAVQVDAEGAAAILRAPIHPDVRSLGGRPSPTTVATNDWFKWRMQAAFASSTDCATLWEAARTIFPLSAFTLDIWLRLYAQLRAWPVTHADAMRDIACGALLPVIGDDRRSDISTWLRGQGLPPL